MPYENMGSFNKLAQYSELCKDNDEKALDCKDAIVELNEKVSELYETAFNNVVTQFEDILSIVDHKQKMLEESITQSEKKGYITSVKYYEALMNNERDNISKLQQEKVELMKSLNEAVNSGAIVKGSESWYEMVNQIDDVTLAIEEANTAMIEYGNSIRDVGWEVFDLLQDVKTPGSYTNLMINSIGAMDHSRYIDMKDITIEAIESIPSTGITTFRSKALIITQLYKSSHKTFIFF